MKIISVSKAKHLTLVLTERPGETAPLLYRWREQPV